MIIRQQLEIPLNLFTRSATFPGVPADLSVDTALCCSCRVRGVSSSDELHPLASVDSYGSNEMYHKFSGCRFRSDAKENLGSNGVSSIGRPKCQPRFPLKDPGSSVYIVDHRRDA